MNISENDMYICENLRLLMITYYTLGKYRRIEKAASVQYMLPVLHPIHTFPVYHDLVYMDDGTWDITCGSEHYDVFKGDVFVLPAGIAHNSKRKCSAGTKTFYIHMLPVTGDNVGGEPPRRDGITRLPISTVIHCQHNIMVRSMFEEIAMLYSSTTPERDDMISAMIQTLLCLLYQCAHSGTTKSQDIVSKCLQIMKEQPNILFKEADMAKLLYVSGKTLRSSFVSRFGKTFYQYQLDSKLGQVCIYLLDYPNMRLNEIAFMLGFCDEFHLSKVFKKKYGVSPNQYKKDKHMMI